MHIVDNKILHEGQKLGWIDGGHIRGDDDAKLGYFENNCVYNEAGHKVAYIHENELMFSNGNESIPLQKVNEDIVGTAPLLTKCAIHVLLQD